MTTITPRSRQVRPSRSRNTRSSPSSPSQPSLSPLPQKAEQHVGAVHCKWRGCNAGAFTSYQAVHKHIRLQHIGTVYEKNVCLKCAWDSCGYTAKSRKHIISHIHKHIDLPRYWCDDCKTSFQLQRKLNKHNCAGSARKRDTTKRTPVLKESSTIVPSKRRREADAGHSLKPSSRPDSPPVSPTLLVQGHPMPVGLSGTKKDTPAKPLDSAFKPVARASSLPPLDLSLQQLEPPSRPPAVHATEQPSLVPTSRTISHLAEVCTNLANYMSPTTQMSQSPTLSSDDIFIMSYREPGATRNNGDEAPARLDQPQFEQWTPEMLERERARLDEAVGVLAALRSPTWY